MYVVSFLSKSEDDAPPPEDEPEPSDRPVSVEDLTGQAEEEGAFNPETGEINWDCPCLGGMAHGPCGEEFREAFSCFVFSNEEPKGIDCIDRFRCVCVCVCVKKSLLANEGGE
jgi:mitochondrial intermembrane space import and assembly protein 40